jgi:hypothetical protein
LTASISRDEEIVHRHLALDLRSKAAQVAKLEAEADMLGEAIVTEQANRRLRNGIAIAAWMGTTVVEVVSVVLVIVNYLFPAERGKYA